MSQQRDTFTLRVEELVAGFETLVDQSEWVTRRYPKKIRDADDEVFEVPALFLQKGTTRLLLDPIGYDFPGTGGAADLYLMPTYDDMASLYFEDDRWVIHYPIPTQFYVHPVGPTAHLDEVRPQPLSAETVNKVLDAIAANAIPSV